MGDVKANRSKQRDGAAASANGVNAIDGTRLVAGLVLLAAALIAWPFLFGRAVGDFLSLGPWGPGPLVVFAVVVLILAGWPPARQRLVSVIDRVRPMPRRRRFWSTIATGAFAAVYLGVTAYGQHRPLYPYFHDECSYLIQAHQFAVGRLWEPAHPLPDFFDSFQLFTTPVYASAYFPGTAILYVPGIWLHLPPWITSLAIAAVVAGLLFRIVAEMFDGVGAVLAIALLFANDTYRQSSTLTMAQMPCLMYGLLATLAWMRWSDRPSARRAVLIGIALGLAAVTRPVDALIFAIPIGFAVALRPTWSVPIKAAVAIAVGVLPFMGLQPVINHGITGEWFRTPFRMYADRDYPGSSYGFHSFDPQAEPVSALPQKRMLYDNQYAPVIARHQWSNVPGDLVEPHGAMEPPRLTFAFAQSSHSAYPILIVLIPLSLLALTRRRAVVVAAGPLFLLLYVPYVFFFPHYVLTAAAAVIAGILAGAAGAEHLLPRHRSAVAVGMVLFIGGLAVAAWPQFDPDLHDIAFASEKLAKVNQTLATIPRDQRAVVLFTFDPQRDISTEPVYNIDVAYPDEARIVRAHDLGPRDGEIIRYYAARQPGRVFYRYEESSGKLILLGPAADLQ
jgi:hypothetical protein